MCLFVNTLRPEITLRVWDIFLNEGSKVIFRIASALFKMHEKRLVAVRDAGDLFSALRNIGSDVVDADALIALAYKDFSPRGSFKHTPVRHQQQTETSSEANKKSSCVNNGQATLNPRLSVSRADYGIVPPELIGIGLAHIGPTKPISVRDADLNPEDSMPATPAVKSMPSITEKEEDEPRISASRNSESIRRDSDTNTPLTERDLEYLRIAAALEEKRNKVRTSSKKKNAVANGMFTFYRSDIALWRASFRPALEERHEKLEAARKKWRNSEIDNRALDGDIQTANDVLDHKLDDLTASSDKLAGADEYDRETNIPKIDADEINLSPIKNKVSSGQNGHFSGGSSDSASLRIHPARADSLNSMSSISKTLPIPYDLDRGFECDEAANSSNGEALEKPKRKSLITSIIH